MKRLIKQAGSALRALSSLLSCVRPSRAENAVDAGTFVGGNRMSAEEEYGTPLTGPYCGIPQSVIDRRRELVREGWFA